MFGVRSTDKDGKTYVMSLINGEENVMDTKTESFAAKQKKVSKVKASAKNAVEKLHQVMLDVAPVAAPSELMMVPVEIIDTEAQVRTEFVDESLRELAGDIARRGVLQPVLLRPGRAGRFTMIAGERRLRACVLAELKSIPAIIGEIGEGSILGMQLAENVQREDLSLMDSAAAVRRIYDECGSVTETGRMIGRSKAWVSKRLKVTCGNIRYEVGWLLENGLCDDLEIILGLDKLFQKDYLTGVDQLEKYKKGDAGRQSIRDALGNIEAIIQERARKNEEADDKADAFRAKAIAERQEQKRINEAEWLKKKRTSMTPIQSSTSRISKGMSSVIVMGNR